jgi:hypothetical protein
MPEWRELSNEQRRQFIDAQQAFEAWREAARMFDHSYDGRYAGSMRWVKRNGKEYLYRKKRQVEKSLGPRSPETEAIKADYQKQRERYRRRERELRNRLDEMAPVNRALKIDRLPRTAARILTALDERGVLGKHIVIIGTNALFAYEARAGVQFASDIVATGDVDLLWDARRRLSLAASDLRASGIIGLLRRVDSSFSLGATYGYSAVNDDGYYVDLVCPHDDRFMRSVRNRFGDAEEDLEPAPIEGLEWLLNAPKFEEIVIGEGGRPAPIVCTDPRIFALHKWWLAQRPDRNPVKRRRDSAQAIAAARLARSHFNLEFDDAALSAAPQSLRAGLHALLDQT